MSDRTRGAVRTGSREAAGEAATDAPAGGERPSSTGTSAPGAPAGNRTTVADGAVAAGSARPDAPADDATARVPGVPSRSSNAAGAADAAVPAGDSGGAQRSAKSAGEKARSAAARGRGPRRARLQLRHIDTWSALKISLVVSIALFFVWMVAVGILFGVLNGLGVFDTLNDLFGQLGSVSGGDTGGEGGSEVITAGVVFGGAAVIGLINIVLMTALCTVGSVVYNLCSDLVGGIEVTLSERD
ncbi:DUF3566 domain-containing protein [Modestobacter lapidis]|nr:DUF3566 domain-containing protein [Modestobacter lapidis]